MRVLGRQDNGGNSLSLAAWLCWGSGGEALPPTQTTMANLWMPLLGGAAYRSSPIFNPLPYEMGDPHPFSPVLSPAPPHRSSMLLPQALCTRYSARLVGKAALATP